MIDHHNASTTYTINGISFFSKHLVFTHSKVILIYKTICITKCNQKGDFNYIFTFKLM